MNPDALEKLSIEFLKLADLQVRVVENRNKFLSTLSGFEKDSERVKFLTKHLKKIGEGSSRIVFKINDKFVIKCAKNKKGKVQNVFEAQPFMQTDVTNKILAADPRGAWIITRFAKNFSQLDFKTITGIDFQQFAKSLTYKLNNYSDYKKPKSYEEIIQSKLFNDVLVLVLNSDLALGDIVRFSSWKQVDDQPVIVDYGLSRDIYDKFYDSDNSSELSKS